MNKHYQHDCDVCIHLGSSNASEHERAFDFYLCGKVSSPCLIARFGNDGPEYSSLDASMVDLLRTSLHPLKVALMLAKVQGLVK